MQKRSSLLALTAAVVLFVTSATPGFCSPEKGAAELVASGEAWTRVEPSTALVSFVLDGRGSNAQKAIEAVTKKQGAIQEGVAKAAGSFAFRTFVRGESLTNGTENRGGQPAPATVASRIFAVEVSKDAPLGAITDAAVLAGANAFLGVELFPFEKQEARNKALDIATRDAVERAKRMAATLGVSLGRLVGTSAAEELVASAGDEEEKDPNMPQAKDELIRVEVTVQYELSQSAK